ncbi:MAG: hypothetical protein COX51_07010, partial [Syntrophobacteraceae bacterium CG23_combo_of_CG06-09_8_20_14_all_50_8]
MEKPEDTSKTSAQAYEKNNAPAGATLSLDARLIRAGLSENVLAETKEVCKTNGASLIDALLQKKTLTEAELLAVFSAHFNIPFWPDLPTERMNTDYTHLFPIQYLKKHRMAPLEFADRSRFVIAVNDPFRFQFVDDLCRELGRYDAELVLSTQEAITAAINIAYDLSRSSAKEFFQEMKEESPDNLISEIEETADLLDETSEAPIIKLVNLLV